MYVTVEAMAPKIITSNPPGIHFFREKMDFAAPTINRLSKVTPIDIINAVSNSSERMVNGNMGINAAIAYVTPLVMPLFIGAPSSVEASPILSIVSVSSSTD